MAMILLLSTEAGNAERTGSVLVPVLRSLFPWASPVALQAIHAAVRKWAHVTEYAMLAVLWYRAFVRDGALGRRRSAAAAVAIAALWGFVDEAHQTMQLTRGGSLADVALDSAGGLLGAAAAHVGWARSARFATGVLLVVATVGGAGVLVLNAAAGVHSGLLWLTVPAAAIALLVRRVHRLS
jgi:VanZ family protein